MELVTPLNQAHYLGRQADKLVKTGKFEEAVRHQDRIVELLQLALGEATNNKVIESLELQIKFHTKQKEVIGHRQKRCEKYTKDLTNLKIKMEKANLAAADGLQDSIFRTFQETESLLQHLRVGNLEESSVPTPPHHTHTTILRLLRSIFTSISPQTCQALSVPHFSATTPLTMNTITPPKCYQLLSLPMCSPATSVLLFSIPVDHPNIQKVRTFSSWNICLPHQEGQSVSSILPPAGCSRICLSGNSQVALLTLAKEMLGIKPDLSLMMDPMMDTLNMYKDPNTLVVVMTDPDSDPAIQLVLQTFFAKIFLPLKLSWVKMVFTHTEKEG